MLKCFRAFYNPDIIHLMEKKSHIGRWIWFSLGLQKWSSLIITWVLIKKLIPTSFLKSIKHFMHKSHGEVIFFCPWVYVLVINAYSRSVHHLIDTRCSFSFGNTTIPPFFDTHYTILTHLLSTIWYITPKSNYFIVFLFHPFFHNWVQTPLMFNTMFTLPIKQILWVQ